MGERVSSVGKLLATFALALYAVAAGASGLDRISGSIWTVERIVPRPFRAEAYRAEVALASIQEDYPRAVRAGARAVWHDPVHPNSVAALATAQLLDGQTNKAYNSYRVAAQFGWRNQSTQAYWFAAALGAGDFRVAADRADAIMRVRNDFAGRDALLEPLETNPEARSIFIDHIVAQPYWVKDYLEIYRVEDEDLIARRVVLLKEAAASGRPLGCEAVNRFTRALLIKNMRSEAQAVWNGNCPQRKVDGLIVDPSFGDVGTEKFPFGWALESSGDVSLRTLDDGGISLQNTAPSARRILNQPVAWPSGTYRLTIETAEPGRSANRLAFSLGCGERAQFPARPNGDPARGGQLISTPGCEKGSLGLWLRPGASVELRRMAVTKVG